MADRISLPGKLAKTIRTEWDTALIGFAVFLFHIWHVPAVAKGVIFTKSNLAFDFDIDRFVALWSVSPFPVIENQNYYAVRHPLSILVRLVCRPIVEAGMDATVAACAVAAFCAALGAMLAFRIALVLGIGRRLAYIMTALWIFSTSSLILGVLPETYTLALVALSAQFLLSIYWIDGKRPALALRIALAVANFGITITNVLLSGLGELIVRLLRQTPRKALMGTAGFSAAVAIIGVTLGFLSFQIWPVDRSQGSDNVAQQVYWDATSAEHTPQRQSVGDVAWIFGAVAFVAPAAARYPSGAPSNPYLWDIRGYAYDALGWLAVLGWLGLLATGLIAAARDRIWLPVWSMAALWIAANIALHSYWQFRDTLFLYTAHSHMAFFILALAGARWAQATHRNGVLIYGCAAALVTLLMALNNFAIYAMLPLLN